MPGTAAAVVWKAEERLIAMTAFHFSGGNSSTRATCWIPALLTNIDGAERGGCLLHQTAAIVGAGHVGSDVFGLDAVRAGEAFGQGVILGRVRERVKDNAVPLRSQRFGNPEANAGGGTRDYGSLVVEHGLLRDWPVTTASRVR
jgi:hypothetical protein